MTEEVPTGVIHITNVAYPTQYVDIRSSKDGGDLIGWTKGNAKQVNQSWLLKPLGNASYYLVGFVPGGSGRPAKLAYVTPNRAPGVSLEGARLRVNSTTNRPGIFNVHYNEKAKAWQIFYYQSEGLVPFYMTLENNQRGTSVKLFEKQMEKNHLWKFTTVSRPDLPVPPPDDDTCPNLPVPPPDDDDTCPENGANMYYG